jgi:hypothetical protein
MLFGLGINLVLMREVTRLSPLVVVVWLAVLLRMEYLLHMFMVLFLQLV